METLERCVARDSTRLDETCAAEQHASGLDLAGRIDLDVGRLQRLLSEDRTPAAIAAGSGPESRARANLDHVVRLTKGWSGAFPAVERVARQRACSRTSMTA